MSTPAYELELEASPEYEYELEGEYEGEFEGEYEAEEFFGRLAGLARRAAQSPALRRVALSAARTALGGLGSVGGSLGGAIGGARGASLGQDLGATLGRHASGWLPQREHEGEFELEGEYEFEGESEFEGEGEFEFEGEYEINPQRRIYNEALMEHLGHAAAEAETEEEAEAFIGALVPIAARLATRAAPAIMRAAPQLMRGVGGVARTLMRSPTTRPLVRAIPSIVRRTAASVAGQVARGQRVTPTSAVRTLARQTARVLSSPQRSVQAYRRSRSLDRHFHRTPHRGTALVTRGRRVARPGPRPPVRRPGYAGGPAVGYAQAGGGYPMQPTPGAVAAPAGYPVGGAPGVVPTPPGVMPAPGLMPVPGVVQAPSAPMPGYPVSGPIYPQGQPGAARLCCPPCACNF